MRARSVPRPPSASSRSLPAARNRRVPELGRHPAAKARELFIKDQGRILFGTDLALGPDFWRLGSERQELMAVADHLPIDPEGRRRNRVEELIAFAQARGIRRIGIAFCVMLT